MKEVLQASNPFYNRVFMGLMSNYFWQSILKSLINIARYPIFKMYYSVDGHTFRSIGALWNVLWMCKIFPAIASDIFTCTNQHRKPFVLLGWLLSFTSVLLLTFALSGPLWSTTCNVNSTYTDYLPAAISLGFSKFGVAVTDSAADGLMVEWTHFESPAIRGRVNAYAHILQKAGKICSYIVSGVLFKGWIFGGESCFSITIVGYFALLSFIGAMAFLLILILFKDYSKETTSSITFRHYFRSFWNQLACPAYQRISVGIFLHNSRKPASNNVKKYYAKVSSSTHVWLSMGVCILEAIGIVLLRKSLHRINWRILITFATYFPLVLRVFVETLTIFNVCRNPFFYYFDDYMESLPEGALYIMVMMLAAEVCQTGCEATMFSALMTVYSLGISVGAACSNYITSFFDVVGKGKFKRDSDQDRVDIWLSFIIPFALQLCLIPVVIFLLLGPRDCRKLIRNSKPRPGSRIILVVTYLTLLIWSVVSNILATHPEYKCLHIVGGKGC